MFAIKHWLGGKTTPDTDRFYESILQPDRFQVSQYERYVLRDNRAVRPQLQTYNLYQPILRNLLEP